MKLSMLISAIRLKEFFFLIIIISKTDKMLLHTKTNNDTNNTYNTNYIS